MTREEAIVRLEQILDLTNIPKNQMALQMAIDDMVEQDEREDPKPLTLDELWEMAGEPVWCSEYQCYGIIKVETIGSWSNTPFLVGVWHDRGVAGNFEYDIEKRGLTIYRSKPKESA